MIKLPASLKTLDLSNNPSLAQETYRVLAEEVIERNFCKLEKLNLEGCRINDTGLKPLAKAIEYCNSLKHLDLSRNMISDLGALDLADMIIGNNGLLVLFLHWNKLLPRGGAAIAKSLCKNNVLQILDISYCSMGGARES